MKRILSNDVAETRDARLRLAVTGRRAGSLGIPKGKEGRKSHSLPSVPLMAISVNKSSMSSRSAPAIVTRGALLLDASTAWKKSTVLVFVTMLSCERKFQKKANSGSFERVTIRCEKSKKFESKTPSFPTWR